jgi:hypothetical protein
MGIALARRVGGYQLGKRVRIIAAANPPEKAAGGWDLAPPVANRLGHLNWDPPPVTSWQDYMLGASVDKGLPTTPEQLEKTVLEAWAPRYAEAIGLVTSFVRAKANQLHQMPDAGDPQAGRAWPSPRTWEMSTRALASGQIHGLDATDAEVFFTAFIGEASASEFFIYRERVDLPDPVAVLKDPKVFKHSAKRLDRTEAVLNSCAALVVGTKEKDLQAERSVTLWKLLGRKEIVEDAVDLAFIPAKTMIQAELFRCKEAKPTLKKMLPVLEAAGVKVIG